MRTRGIFERRWQGVNAGRSERWAIAAAVLLALGVRLVVLPLATTDGGDAPSRVWAGWEWLSHPELLTHGVWGPLHFYLIGLSLAVVPDPVRGPVALSVAFSVASVAVLYWFVRLEFADARVALLVALSYAVYPIAVRNSVSVRSETPFVFFMLLAMVAVASARGQNGSWRHAAGGGLALTLAAALRYEAWMLLPLLSLLLWRRPRLMLLFAICAVVHPAFWLAGNWLHSGDAWYGFTAAASWELESMGRAQVDRGLLAAQAAAYPLSVLEGMSLPIGLICVAGVALALAARQRGAAWLLPLVGVLGLWALAIARGALVPKLNYTEIAGTMLFAFSGVVYQLLGMERWRPGRLLLVAIALPVTSLTFSCKPCLARARLGWLAGFSPVPRIENQDVALALAGVLRDELRPGGSALVSDHYGWGATQYVALLTGLPRSRIFLAPGALNQQLDPDSLAAFLRHHPRGVAVALSGSRLSRLLDLAPGVRNATVGGISLRLDPRRSIAWPGRGPATLMVFRYAVPESGSAAEPPQ